MWVSKSTLPLGSQKLLRLIQGLVQQKSLEMFTRLNFRRSEDG